MRRFFSRNKDSSSSNNNNSENKDNKQAVLHGQKASSRLIAQKDVFVDKPAAAVVEASPTAKQDIPSSNTARAEQGPPTTPAKQVAFAVKTLPATPESLLRTPEHRDAYSHVSFHGRSSENVARSPAALSCFPNSNMMGNRSTSNPLYTTQHLSPIVPSQPIRHVSLDVPSAAREKDRDATLRASQTATSPARGEIPRFQGPTTPTTGQHQQRSGTSMSHDTSVSTTSSLADARQAFYGSNNNSSSADKMYYPNLAVLATYSRDMSAMNGTNGQHSIMQHLTWSEITDEQLVENLGGRERTRQEVLFEMVCSEERYVQELIALKENYLQPLLERHCLSAAHFPSSPDDLAASTMRSTSGTSPSLDVQPYHTGTMKSTTSIEGRRPFLSLSAGTASTNIRYATPVSSDHGHGNLYSRASHRPSEAHPAISMEHLPIAARFARRVSIDSPLSVDKLQGQAVNDSTTNTARTAIDETPEGKKYERRDISGGSGGTGTTAVDSGDDTDYSLPKEHVHFGVLNGKGKSKSRLHPIFANLGHSARPTEKGNMTAMESTTSVNATKTFKHHLKNLVPPPPNKLHKTSSPDLKGSNGRLGLAGPGWVVKELPSDLKLVSEVVADQILDGHRALSERLRVRYEEQFPLVRTLADVFHDQAWMIEHYSTYVLHLERALADIDEALSLVNPLVASSKKVKSKDKELIKEQKILAKVIMHLEEEAALKGAPGLSICLSQPFQRLLKYPLLFQSLLYHTDPSTRDYDATQKLAFEIDGIVRSIESEKASEEDRARTRDVWARIDGINDRALLSPRSDRFLVSEAAMWSLPTIGDSAVAAGRRTFSDAARTVDEAHGHTNSRKKTARRLSDMTGMGSKHNDPTVKKKKEPSIGSKRDVWLVSFTDVVIRCQRVGVTNLPMQNSLDAGKQSLSINVSQRRTVLLSAKERNLYKFLKIDHWVMEDKTSPGRSGIVSMVDVARSRQMVDEHQEDRDDAEAQLETEPIIEPVKFERDEQLGAELNGAKSVMSFAYSNDELRPVVFDIDPLVGLAHKDPHPHGTVIAKIPAQIIKSASPATQQAAQKRGLAAAKFCNRLRPSIGESNQGAPSAKRAASPPAARPSPRSVSAAHERERVRGGFNKPTAASLAKASPPTSAFLTPGNKFPRAENGRSTPPNAKRIRAASSNASPGSPRPSTSTAAIPPSPQSPPRGALRGRRNSLPSAQAGEGARQLRTKHSSEKLGQHGKFVSETDSGVVLYNQYWKDDK